MPPKRKPSKAPKFVIGPSVMSFYIEDGPRSGRYEGEMRNGQRHGEGTFTFTEQHRKGDIYQGTWGRDKMNGNGTYCWSCGDVYRGEWLDNYRHGRGSVLYAAHEEVFEGDWQDDVPHGRGRQLFANGDVFEADFVKGVKKGAGAVVWRDGQRREGVWEGDMFVESRFIGGR